MKTVVNVEQVAHLWANQSQATARNGSKNFYFEGATIFSYGSHFPLAVFTPWNDTAGNRIVLENGAQPSVTTGKHQRYIGTALRGHPVRIVTVHGSAKTWGGVSGLSALECERIARGDSAPLVDIIGRTARHAADLVAAAMRRRSASYAAYGLQNAAAIYADLDTLAAVGRTVKERKTLARAIGTRPEIPAGYLITERVGGEYGYDRETAAPNFWEIVAPLRDAMRKQTAAADMRHDRTAAARHWRDARNTRLPIRSRFTDAESCLRHVRKVAAICKRARVDYPRELPTVDKARALVDILRPRAALQWARDQVANIGAARLSLVRDYWLGKRLNRDSAMRAAYGRPWNTAKRKLADRDAPRTIETMRAISAFLDSGQIPTLAPECGELLAAALPIAAENSRRGRAMLRELRAIRSAMEEFNTAAHWIRRRIQRTEAREELEFQKRTAESAIAEARALIAGGAWPHETVRQWHNGRAAALLDTAIQKANRYARELAETCEKAPELARGLPAGFDVADLERGKDLAEFNACRGIADQSAAECSGFMRTAAEFENRGHVYSARDTAEKALTAARNFASADGNAAKIAAAHSFEYVPAADSGAMLDTATAEFERLRNACRSMSVSAAVHAWRIGDNAARETFGYGGEPRFRVALNGVEIESSLGARVSVAAGRILWRLIRKTVQTGAGLEFEYGKGPHIGAFQISAIRPDGSARVGCHEITAAEAREFAAFMHWPSLDAAPEDDSDECAA